VQEVKQEFFLEYMKEFGEPIFDVMAPVETFLIRKCSEALGTNDVVVVDGQGADSLFMGLLHNSAIHYYLRVKPIIGPIPSFANLFLRKRNFHRNSEFGRFIYRASKMSFILSKQDVVKAFLVSLGYFDSFKEILHKTQSPHNAISYFFMYRILPVREMQKYRLLINENLKFSFPYIDKKMFMFNKGIKKRIIFDLAKEILPEVVYTNATAPFYLDSSNIFKKMDDEVLKTLLSPQFMVFKSRIIDKEQFEFVKRIMSVYFYDYLNQYE